MIAESDILSLIYNSLLTNIFFPLLFLIRFLENVIRDSVTYTEHARRKTVTAM